MTNLSKNVIGKNVAATGAVLALAPWGWLATTCAIVFIFLLCTPRNQGK
jgi:hypothetical protein